MPRPQPEGWCIRCGEHYPSVVKHHSKGACASCHVLIRREQIRTAKDDGSIEGAAATVIMVDGRRNAQGLAELLLRVEPERFAIIQRGEDNNLHVRDQRNVWVELPEQRLSTLDQTSAVYGLVEELRSAQAEEMAHVGREWLSEGQGSISQCIANMRLLARHRGIQSMRQEQVDKQPPGVFLLVDGVLDVSTANQSVEESADEDWNMTDGVTLLLTREEAGKIINLKWEDVPEQTREDVDWLWFRHHDFYRMAAYRLNVRDKGVDHYMDSKSGAGKTTAAFQLEWAFPGLVKVIKVGAKIWENQQWSELNIHLAERLLTIADEAGMVNLSRDTVVELTQPEVPVARKKEQHHMRPRMGSLIVMGADWSFISADAQGVEQRIGQVAEATGTSTSREIYERLEHNLDARRYLAKKMLDAQLGAKPVVDEDRKHDLIRRGQFSGIERFVYSALEVTGKFEDKADLLELSHHKLMKVHGVSAKLLYARIVKAIEAVFLDGKSLDPTKIEKEEKMIVAIRGFKIRSLAWL